MKISQSGYLLESNKKIIYQPKNQTIPPSSYISLIEIDRDHFVAKLNEKSEKWLFIKQTTFTRDFGTQSRLINEYRMKQGDVIRLGYFKFKIIELNAIPFKAINSITNELKSSASNLNNSNANLLIFNETTNNFLCLPKHLVKLNTNINNNGNSVRGSVSTNSLNPLGNYYGQHHICRICKESSFTSPLINPCNCEGSLKYVHLECLKKYAQTMVECIKSDKVTIINCPSIICLYCKGPLPFKVKIGNQIISVIDFVRPDGNYLVLERYYNDDFEEDITPGTMSGASIRGNVNNKYVLSLYIIRVKEEEFKIGKEKCDLTLNEPLIEDNHASITYFQGAYYLKDLTKSQFSNTYVLLQDDIMLIPNMPLAFISSEIGEYIFKFEMKMNFCKKLLCYKNKIFQRLNYHKILSYAKTNNVYEKDNVKEVEVIESDEISPSPYGSFWNGLSNISEYVDLMNDLSSNNEEKPKRRERSSTPKNQTLKDTKKIKVFSALTRRLNNFSVNPRKQNTIKSSKAGDRNKRGSLESSASAQNCRGFFPFRKKKDSLFKKQLQIQLKKVEPISKEIKENYSPNESQSPSQENDDEK